jgi:endonuclease YncB( thermonuclease family)
LGIVIRRVAGFESLTDPSKAGPIHVVDGDDVTWSGRRYRLAGYDAPEVQNLRSKFDQGLESRRGHQAKRRLRELIENAVFIDLIPLKKRDKSGRELAQLMVNGEDVAAIALAERWGCPYRVRKDIDWGDPKANFEDGLPLPDAAAADISSDARQMPTRR